MTQENSLQRIFNVAWEHFIVKDNPPGLEYLPEKEYYVCKYLTPDGRKCAIGLCIPDGHEAQNYDGSFSGIVRHFPELFPDLVNMESSFLNKFQERLHDELQTGGTWQFSKEERKQKYLAVAKDYGLTIPEHSS